MHNVIIEKEVQHQLLDLKNYLLNAHGKAIGTSRFSEIMSSLDNLQYFADIGSNIKEKYNVKCPDNWFLLYSNMNYFIYSKNDSTITILKMYNNKQDFIYDLFGVKMRSQESIDYWGE
ncbi:MAG: hypothetical protein E7242_05500 [Lachnospiraceae bacterium]|nr:hypothetical protein [Lachnospiraceae bacterium]MCR5081944.1 hypothetical protein [Parasporobacterium sp.]